MADNKGSEFDKFIAEAEARDPEGFARARAERAAKEADVRERAQLKARVANLEVALHAMWAMLAHLQPPETQDGISSMLRQHFDATRDMGGLQHGTFERA